MRRHCTAKRGKHKANNIAEGNITVHREKDGRMLYG